MESTTTTTRPAFGLRHRLALAMEIAHVEPEELAEALGVHPNTVHNYAHGRTTPKRAAIRTWAETCHVDADWLETGEGSSFTKWERAPLMGCT